MRVTCGDLACTECNRRRQAWVAEDIIKQVIQTVKPFIVRERIAEAAPPTNLALD